MLTTEEKISLKNLGKGAVIDKFDTAFENVLRDIIDLNTSEKVRTITIKAKIVPDEARSLIAIEVTNDIKKPGEKPCKAFAEARAHQHRRCHGGRVESLLQGDRRSRMDQGGEILRCLWPVAEPGEVG